MRTEINGNYSKYGVINAHIWNISINTLSKNIANVMCF